MCFLRIIYNLSNTQPKNQYMYKEGSMSKLPLLLKDHAYGWMDEWMKGWKEVWRDGEINNWDKKKIYSWKWTSVYFEKTT